MSDRPITVVSRIERKDPRLPRYAVIPAAAIAPWRLSATRTVEGEMHGQPFGRKSLKPWGDGVRWFLDVTQPMCTAAGVDTGDEVTFVLRLASEDLPAELTLLLRRNRAARARWEALTAAQQRMVREEVGAARQAATRARRAAKLLGSPDA